MKTKKNKFYNGFQLLETQNIKAIDSIANLYVHTISGAKLLHIQNKDNDKVFSISFKTPPNNNTGVSHIIEHCVLLGSRKYKTKAPIVDMSKGSLKNYVNAMTFNDKTIYSISSKNNKDFENYMDVYLDSVFFPKFMKDKRIFMQEGWHYNINSNNDQIKYKGVVYNEMLSTYSSPMSKLKDLINLSLYPDTPYKYSYAGDPDYIPNLRYEELKEYYLKHYHPQNSYFFIYGDGDIQKYLKHIDKEYLSKFKKTGENINIPLQNKFSERIRLSDYYDILSNDDISKNTYLSMNFVIGEAKNVDIHLISLVLKIILTDKSTGILRNSLLNSGIGDNVICNIGSGKQIHLSIIVANAEISQKSEFEDAIYYSLSRIISTGIDKGLLEKSVNIIEFNLLENYGYATKGSIYNMLSLSSWLYDGHPTDILSFNYHIKMLRDKIKSNFFEKFIETNLLNNQHSSIITLEPRKLLESKRNSLQKKLEKHKESMDPNQLKLLIEENNELRTRQLTEDSKECIDTIPKLSINDINQTVPIHLQEIYKENNITIIYNNTCTQSVAYIELLFDTKILDCEEIKYLEVLTYLLGNLDTDTMTSYELSNAIYKSTGGIELLTRVYTDINNLDLYYPKMVVSSKVHSNKLLNMFYFINIIIKDTLIDNTTKIREILSTIKSKYQMTFNKFGDTFTSNRLTSYFSEPAKYQEEIKGFKFYWFIIKLIKDFDINSQDVIIKLNKVYKKVFNCYNLLISYTGDHVGFHEFMNHYEKALVGISNEKMEKLNHNFKAQQLNEGIMCSLSLQYISKGFNYKKLGYNYSGAMKVFQTIINNDFLYKKIRENGGAYGCKLLVQKNGNMMITSYKDPHLVRTLNMYNQTKIYFNNLNSESNILRNCIIGTISDLDRTLNPKASGIIKTSHYIRNITYTDLQKERDEILGVTVNELKEISNILQKVIDKNYLCVLGNNQKLKENETIFRNLIHLD
ncbi:MAG: insulinase family protein [Alphaproteobacteria bacterium]|nr:insulinase family protein [Alphaproteobacteria bacterium]